VFGSDDAAISCRRCLQVLERGTVRRALIARQQVGLPLLLVYRGERDVNA
jgi:hypothetical protein